ncbi:MAG: hypothetical protein NVS2B14_15330 [Chamaesiphon sp.]
MGIAAECFGMSRADYLEHIVKHNHLPSITREEPETLAQSRPELDNSLLSPSFTYLSTFGRFWFYLSCHFFGRDYITCLDLGLQFDYFLKKIIAFIALIIPILLQLIYLVIGQILEPKYAKFFPYAVQFAPPYKENFYHFGILGLIGVVLLIIHIVSKTKYSSVQNAVIYLESK